MIRLFIILYFTCVVSGKVSRFKSENPMEFGVDLSDKDKNNRQKNYRKLITGDGISDLSWTTRRYWGSGHDFNRNLRGETKRRHGQPLLRKDNGKQSIETRDETENKLIEDVNLSIFDNIFSSDNDVIPYHHDKYFDPEHMKQSVNNDNSEIGSSDIPCRKQNKAPEYGDNCNPNDSSPNVLKNLARNRKVNDNVNNNYTKNNNKKNIFNTIITRSNGLRYRKQPTRNGMTDNINQRRQLDTIRAQEDNRASNFNNVYRRFLITDNNTSRNSKHQISTTDSSMIQYNSRKQLIRNSYLNNDFNKRINLNLNRDDNKKYNHSKEGHSRKKIVENNDESLNMKSRRIINKEKNANSTDLHDINNVSLRRGILRALTSIFDGDINNNLNQKLNINNDETPNSNFEGLLQKLIGSVLSFRKLYATNDSRSDIMNNSDEYIQTFNHKNIGRQYDDDLDNNYDENNKKNRKSNDNTNINSNMNTRNTLWSQRSVLPRRNANSEGNHSAESGFNENRSPRLSQLYKRRLLLRKYDSDDNLGAWLKKIAEKFRYNIANGDTNNANYHVSRQQIHRNADEDYKNDDGRKSRRLSVLEQNLKNSPKQSRSLRDKNTYINLHSPFRRMIDHSSFRKDVESDESNLNIKSNDMASNSHSNQCLTMETSNHFSLRQAILEGMAKILGLDNSSINNKDVIADIDHSVAEQPIINNNDDSVDDNKDLNFIRGSEDMSSSTNKNDHINSAEII